jgi:hypothetical protein
MVAKKTSETIIMHLACLLCFINPSLQYCYKANMPHHTSLYAIVATGEAVAVEGAAVVGVEVGAGVGLHAQTASFMLPVTCAQHSAGRIADAGVTARM